MAEGEGKATYFMLEIHYENPSLMKGDRQSNIVDVGNTIDNRL